MKRYLLYILLFLCGMRGSAQDLSEEEFERARACVVIAFTRATMPDYVEKLPDADRDNYEQKIKKELFENVTSIQALERLLETNGFAEFKKKFVERFQMDFRPISREALYDTLYARLNGKNIRSLACYAFRHKEDIAFDEIFPLAAGIPAEESLGADAVEDMRKQLEEMRNRMNVDIPKIVVPVLGGILLLFLFLIGWLCRVRSEVKRLKKWKHESLENKKEMEEKMAFLESDMRQQQLRIQQLQEDMKQMNRLRPVEKTEEAPRAVAPVADSRPAVVENKDKIVYAEVRDGNLEMATEKERKYYKITCARGSDVGEFELVDDYDMVMRAMKSKEEYIDPVCETQGSTRNEKGVRRIKPGKVRTKDGETWEVYEKAIIEYES